MQPTPTNKYHGEQDARYGGQLQWPGANGYPFVGDVAPSLKQHELDALPIMGRAYEELFDLNDEDQRTEYNWVRDRIRNGLFVRDKEIVYDPPEKGHWPIIYLEWTQLFVMAPHHLQTARSNGHGSSTQFTLRRPRKDV
jgi:hypothetical protein